MTSPSATAQSEGMSNADLSAKVMKALVWNAGTPHWSVTPNDTPVPTLTSSTQVLVQVRAAGLNPADSKLSHGWMDLLLPHLPSSPRIPGIDFAGVIAQVGKDSSFHVGDYVYGKLSRISGFGNGTCAEYVVVDTQADCLQPLPPGVSFEDGASVGVAAITAYTGLITHGKLSEDSKNDEMKHVLIIGASGGVGVWAMRLAKFLNANVTAVCSKKNESFVKGLGADYVLDYAATHRSIEDQWRALELPRYDVIFDCVGGDEYWRICQPMLKKGGVYSTAVGHIKHGEKLSLWGLSTLFYNISVRNMPFLGNGTSYRMVLLLANDPFVKLNEWITAGRLHIVPAQHKFLLQNAVKAFELIDSHRSTGKVVLTIG